MVSSIYKSNSNAIVSIIVPVYNCEKTIAETIESVLSQSYPNWELICVDDGSSDGGESIVRSYCDQDSRIRFLKRARLPKGGSVCRNIGAFESKGDYLIFLDGDDLLTSNCLEDRLKVIEPTEADFAVFPMASFNGDAERAKKCSRTEVKNMKYYFASAQGGWQITSPIYRCAFFKSLGGFNEDFPRLQDIEIHLRAILKSGDNYIVKDDFAPDCLYRMGTNHYSLQKIFKGLNAHRLFFQLLSDNIEQFDNKTNRSIAILNNFCSIFVGLYTLKRHNIDVAEFDDFWKIPLLDLLMPCHRVLYKFFKRIYSSRLGLFLIKSARKILLMKFIKFS